MPDGYNSEDAAIAASASNSINQLSGYMAASNLNKRTQKFSREMYEKTKADNLAFWNMQNEYNSPQNQMARLKAAGLNPNLIYGNGGGQTQAGDIKSGELESWNPQVPPTGVANPVLTYYDVKMRDAQLENMNAQNRVINNDALLKMTQILNNSEGLIGAKLKNQNLEELVKLYPEMLQGNLDKLLNEIRNKSYEGDILRDRSMSEGERIALEFLTKRKANAKTDAQIKMIDQMIDNLKKSGRLLDENLKDAETVGTNAPWMIKLFQRVVRTLTGN